MTNDPLQKMKMKFNLKPFYMLLAILVSVLILLAPDKYMEPDFQSEYRAYAENTWEQAGGKGLNPQQAAEFDRRALQFEEDSNNQDMKAYFKSLFKWMFIAHLVVMLAMYIFCRFLKLQNKWEVLAYSIVLAITIIYAVGVVSALLISLVFLVASLKQVIKMNE